MARGPGLGRLQWADALGIGNVRGAIASAQFSESCGAPVSPCLARRGRVQGTAGMGLLVAWDTGISAAAEWRSPGRTDQGQPFGPVDPIVRTMERRKLGVVRAGGDL